ncbi:universal stress protein [Halomarina rubra]|uniref:Universal stress protein n=1 Tax=Halomarina rubra TaxID=2071873 RepID=A0ABD6AT11_9EURY|nr:universal stress protein [Halomarina rubra]
MFETVVIASDASPSAERAVTVALDFAERFDADVHVLSVVEDDGHEQLIRTRLARFGASLDRSVTTAVRRGDPADAILRYVERVDADLVATGTRGRDSPYSYHLGSVAERIAHDCPVPVLTVRQLEAVRE